MGPRTDIDPSVVRGLSTLLDFRDARRPEWSADELGAMWRHELAAPLRLALGSLSAEVEYQLRELDPPLNPLISLAEVLHQSAPPVSLLMLIKRFAKACRRSIETPLPSEIVMLLYYASIAAAMVRAGEPISELPTTSFRRGLRMLKRQPWVDEPTRTILREAWDRLSISPDMEQPPRT